MPGEFKTLSSRIIHEDRWMRLRLDAIERPSGAPGSYTVVEKPDFAVIAAIDGGMIHLVEQYRYPVGGRYWELPQGSWSGEGTLAAEELAARELREETGLVARAIRRIGFIHTAYGYSTQGCHIFHATELEHVGQALDAEEEDLVTRAVAVADFAAMIRAGTITDATTIAAFAHLQLHDLV